MKFNVLSKNSNYDLDVNLKKLIVVGFAGRNVEKTLEHIKELEAEGIKCPKNVPVVYECSPEILTTAKKIDVIGHESSGEVEYIVLIKDAKTYIGIGSDHTDRALEAVSIHKSKQLCLKPLSTTLWDFDDIKDHFEQIKLSSTQVLNGNLIEYQSGVTGDLLALDVIIKKVQQEIPDLNNCLLFTGTVPLKSGFKYGERFACKLVDEKLGRELSLEYSINVIEEH